GSGGNQSRVQGRGGHRQRGVGRRPGCRLFAVVDVWGLLLRASRAASYSAVLSQSAGARWVRSFRGAVASGGRGPRAARSAQRAAEPQARSAEDLNEETPPPMQSCWAQRSLEPSSLVGLETQRPAEAFQPVPPRYEEPRNPTF